MKDNKTLKIIILITGILTVLLGIYTLVRPMRTFLSIGWILGILLFVNGIELVALSLSKERRNRRMYPRCSRRTCRSCFTFSGIQRFITDVMAAYMVGAVILIYGIFQIVGGIKTYSTSRKGILSIICGILSVIVSIVSFTHPVLTMISAGYMIAFSVLMQGINMIVLGINFGKAES